MSPPTSCMSTAALRIRMPTACQVVELSRASPKTPIVSAPVAGTVVKDCVALHTSAPAGAAADLIEVRRAWREAAHVHLVHVGDRVAAEVLSFHTYPV